MKEEREIVNYVVIDLGGWRCRKCRGVKIDGTGKPRLFNLCHGRDTLEIL